MALQPAGTPRRLSAFCRESVGWLSVAELCLRRLHRVGGGSVAAAVWPGDDLQQVTVRVLEGHAAAAVAVVDHTGLGLAWIRPVRQLLGADAVKGCIEFLLADE